MQQDLKSLGDQLKLIDQGIMDLVLKRMQLARQVGFLKYLKGDEISRPLIEDSRIAGIRQYAESIGLNLNFASSLLYSLIDESCKEQMIQLQRGNLLRENMMKLQDYGIETSIKTKLGEFKAFNIVPKSLSFQDREYLFSLVYPVAQSAFGQPHSEKFAHDVKVHTLDHTEILIVQDENDNTIAFRIWDVLTEYSKPIIYLAGMCVSVDHQKGGIGPAMIEAAIRIAEQSHKDWGYVVLRTQNWAMQKSMASIAEKSGLYQKFGDNNISPDLQGAAKIVADKNGDLYFNPETLVSRGIYGASLYGSKENFQEGFEGLNAAAGDAAYCVWQR
jgi:chorismate mutase/GNAT superfamily N-acetyltransferase